MREAPAQGSSIGKRSFAVTRFVEDPLVADELLLPSVVHIKRPHLLGDVPTKETDVAAEVMKVVTPDFAVSVAGTWVQLDREGATSVSGFDNLTVALKYKLFQDDTRETVVSLGVAWDVGGTGRGAIGANSFDVVSPGVFWGKGFGDLPDALRLLEPLAITGMVGADIPTSGTTRTARTVRDQAVIELERNPDVLQWGFVAEYSLAYLQSFVADTGLRAPIKQLIPLVELALQTPIDRGAAGRTMGTVNPGFVWQGEAIQIGVEAVVPINSRTGKNVGVQASLTFFLAELLPKRLGRPLFGY